MNTFNFDIDSENGVCQVSFQITDSGIQSSCNCNHKIKDKLCWHRNYVLCGKTQRLPEGELKQQVELISLLSKTTAGKTLLWNAKRAFGETETCRRCSSRKVIELNNSWRGKIIAYFLPAGRTHYCRACKWSW